MRVIVVDESNGKRVFSRKEVADLCNVTTQTIRKWEKLGGIPVSTKDDRGYSYWYEDEVEKIQKYSCTSLKERNKI